MAIFADTSYFLALLQPDGVFFQAANAFAQSNRIPLITTSAIMLELGNALSARTGRRQFLEINRLVDSGMIECVFLTPSLYARAVSLFAEWSDKAWSLTDCVSFVVMSDNAIDSAATTDHHFAQAGFQMLLAKSPR